MGTLAERAFRTQGPEIKKDNPYIGHDTFQNGALIKGDETLYTAGWSENWGGTSGFSGFLTDSRSINQCTHESILNTNELDGVLQTKLSDWGTSTYDKETGIKIPGDYQAHSHVSAYKVDHNRLNEIKESNSALYEKLTNPDGMTPNSSSIKCAYGMCEANTHNGCGGGNQYYIEPNTFREGIKEGVFEYKPELSYSTEKNGGLNPAQREDIPYEEYNEKYAKDFKGVEEKEKANAVSRAQERERLGISESEQINSQIARESNYIAQPSDGYSRQNDFTEKEESALSDNHQKAEEISKSDTYESDNKNEQISAENKENSLADNKALENPDSITDSESNDVKDTNELAQTDNEGKVTEQNKEANADELTDSNAYYDDRNNLQNENSAEELMGNTDNISSSISNEYESNELYDLKDNSQENLSNDCDVSELRAPSDDIQANNVENSAEELVNDDVGETSDTPSQSEDASELVSDENMNNGIQLEECNARELTDNAECNSSEQSSTQDFSSDASTETENAADTSSYAENNAY